MITVITATHNHARHLPGAVASVRNQTHQDWEHIIIDDGSTDETPQVIKELHAQCQDSSAAKLRSFRTENQGLALTLNLGIAEAKGDYIAFLDSDDEYCPDHLSLMLDTIGNLDFALGRFELINCSMDPRPMVKDFYNHGMEIEVEKTEVGTGVLFGKRELFTRLGGFRKIGWSDTDFFNRMKDAGHSWQRAVRPSYRYFFGRVPNNMAIRELESDRLARKPG